MSCYSTSFGIVIARLRVQNGLSQETASRRCGLARSHLAMLENGRKTARLDTLWRLAEAYHLRPSEMIRLTEEELQKSTLTHASPDISGTSQTLPPHKT